MNHFGERLLLQVHAVGNPCCVGLDPHSNLLPKSVQALPEVGHRLVSWGTGVLDALRGIVPAVKPQVAFYEAHGDRGVWALQHTVKEARRLGFIVVLDAKRSDIGSTARAYAHATLHRDGPMDADSVTVSPYLGPESLAPFLDVCAVQQKGS